MLSQGSKGLPAWRDRGEKLRLKTKEKLGFKERQRQNAGIEDELEPRLLWRREVDRGELFELRFAEHFHIWHIYVFTLLAGITVRLWPKLNFKWNGMGKSGLFWPILFTSVSYFSTSLGNFISKAFSHEIYKCSNHCWNVKQAVGSYLMLQKRQKTKVNKLSQNKLSITV